MSAAAICSKDPSDPALDYAVENINRAWGEIQTFGHHAEDALRAALLRAIYIGRQLTEAKVRLREIATRRGRRSIKFDDWMEGRFPFTPRTASRYSAIAREFGHLLIVGDDGGLIFDETADASPPKSIREAYSVCFPPPGRTAALPDDAGPAYVRYTTRLVCDLEKRFETAPPEDQSADEREQLLVLLEPVHRIYERIQKSMG